MPISHNVINSNINLIIRDFDNNQKYSDEQLALICATEIVKEEIRSGWPFDGSTPEDRVKKIAKKNLDFLINME